MSKTNKERLLKMDLQLFAAEPDLTKMDDLGEIKSIDFVNRFEKGIKELLELLGVTRLEPLSKDMKIQMYKWTTSLKDGNVAEGDRSPLLLQLYPIHHEMPLHLLEFLQLFLR